MAARRRWRLGLYLLLVVPLSLLAVEALTRVGYRVVFGEWFALAEQRAAMRAKEEAEEGAPRTPEKAGRHFWRRGPTEALHPYLGFVPEPPANAKARTGVPGQVRSRSDDKRIVGVFGGSFAAGLCRYGGNELRRELGKLGPKIELLCLAGAGYKQPQQLLLLTYLLSLGGALDVVVNVDGFNDVVLPVVENLPKGVFPIYPRAWFFRVRTVEDPRVTQAIAALYGLDRERERWADRFVAWGLDRSVALTLVWQRGDRQLAEERSGLVAALDELRSGEDAGYATTGPKLAFAGVAEAIEYVAKVWRDSSLQMKRICDANAIAYYHFLQPNQYVEGSKPMTAAERAVAVRADHPYRRAAVAGYPVLRRLGRGLKDEGVNYFDLTMVFRDVEAPLYKDDCCHLNPDGYERVARRIARLIHTDLSPRPPRSSASEPELQGGSSQSSKR